MQQRLGERVHMSYRLTNVHENGQNFVFTQSISQSLVQKIDDTAPCETTHHTHQRTQPAFPVLADLPPQNSIRMKTSHPGPPSLLFSSLLISLSRYSTIRSFPLRAFITWISFSVSFSISVPCSSRKAIRFRQCVVKRLFPIGVLERVR